MRHTQSSDRCQACRQKATIPLLHIAMFQFFTVCDDKSWRDDRCLKHHVLVTSVKQNQYLVLFYLSDCDVTSVAS